VVSQISVFDITGKLVQSFAPSKSSFLNTVAFDASAGMYFIQIATGNKVITQKIIKE